MIVRLLVCLVVICHILARIRNVYGFLSQLRSVDAVLDAHSSVSPLRRIALSQDVPPPFNFVLLGLGDGASPCRREADEKFSRTDGYCNNIRNPLQGGVFMPERRLFPNTYDDGRGFPRTRGVDFNKLPSAREVSRRFFGSEEDWDGPGLESATQIVWQYGQFIAHDISLVEPVPGVDHCCDEYTPGLEHPDLYRENGACYSIPIDEADPAFDTLCMPFARSFSVDFYERREFPNGVTSYIDASTIYGSTFNATEELRLRSQGLLRTFKGYLLPSNISWGPPPCRSPLLTRLPGCPSSGDPRVHEQPGLDAMHTMFHLEHNRIARKLFELNTLCDDEAIFQVTKKIMIAIMQRITYEEFLPVILGEDVMNIFHLNDPWYYNEFMDATAIIEFSTASFRFGHTLINTFVDDVRLSHGFFRAVEGLDYHKLMFYQANNHPLLFDNRFTDELRTHLFQNASIPDIAPPGVSFDLLARNIQRGRDHGIATYAVARDFCNERLHGLPGRYQFTSLSLLNGIYRDDRDIDLFVGGISETPLPSAVMGPTFACINAIQFERLKFGDRFFYEGDVPEGFTDEQRAFIRRNSMASLMCQMAPYQYLQRNVFRSVSKRNPLVPCWKILHERRLEEGLRAFECVFHR